MKISADAKIYIEPWALKLIQEKSYIYPRLSKEGNAINLFLVVHCSAEETLRLKNLYGGFVGLYKKELATWTAPEKVLEWLVRKCLEQDRNFILQFQPHPMPELLKKKETPLLDSV